MEAAGNRIRRESTMSDLAQGSIHPPKLAADVVQDHEDLSNLGPVELRERVQALQAEITRLQALVCYLVHGNEELRRQIRP